MTEPRTRRGRVMARPDHRRTCECGHRYHVHAKDGQQCLAVVDDPDASALKACSCHRWSPKDAFYKGGAYHRRTVELLALLIDAVKVQRTPCFHQGIGLPGCVTCDPRIRDALGVGQMDTRSPESSADGARSRHNEAPVNEEAPSRPKPGVST